MNEIIDKLAEREARAASELEPQLREHLEAAHDAWVLLFEAVTAFEGQRIASIPLAARVCAGLLARIANDLRAAELLATRGYPLQSLTIVSALFESAYAVAMIGASEAQARRWVDHDSPTLSFERVKAMIESVIRASSVPSIERSIELERRSYAQLCMARHANPILQMQLGVREGVDSAGWIIGPDASDGAIRGAWYALDSAVRLVLIATGGFARAQLTGARLEEITLSAALLTQKRLRLSQLAIDRGWANDPLPGRW